MPGKKTILFAEDVAHPAGGYRVLKIKGAHPLIRCLAALLSLLLFLSSGPIVMAQSARAVMSPTGGGVGGGRGAAPALQNAGAASAAATAARARETLAHTDNQVAAMRALQTSARAAMVPTSYNGLHPEGLQPHTTARWVGANTPVSTVDANGNHHVEIVQESQNAFLYWNRFNVGSKTRLNFNQSRGGGDAGKWIAFNKVMGSVSPSEIHGSITAQGQVYILNQNGILFRNGSQINTRGLVASSLPINPYFAGDPQAGVGGRGILNNTDYQFLFTALKTDKSPSYPEIFDPGTISSSQIGGVVVEKGALISAPTSAANTGGRVMLAGSSVVNRGTISTPDGQTILAAGLQVGVNSHPAADPSLRGLDVHIGRVVDASGGSVDRDGMVVGTVVNEGMVDVPRGNATLAGRIINQSGILESSTSVTVNGRFDLMSSFNAVVSRGTTARPYYYDPTRPEGTTGSILFGPNSLTRILPEWGSTEKLPGMTTALPSLVSALAGSIRLAQGAYIHAPGADVPASLSPLDMTSATRQQPSDTSSITSRLGSGINLRAGNWAKPSVQDYGLFLLGAVGSSPAGSITMDQGAVISAAGSTGTESPFSRNFLSVQLRGPELANSPLQRSSSVRGETLMLDARISGTYNGQYWVGTPLGDATGFLNLIERTVGELTAKGGTISLSAGDRIALNPGSSMDVSGGWVNFGGGFASTSKLLYRGHLVDISQATPDRVYDGIYQGGGTVQKYEKWGVTKTFSMSPLDPMQKRYEPGYLHGANGGSILIQAPSMQLAGSLLGEVVTGPRQLRTTSLLSTLPSPSSLSLQIKNSRIEGTSAVDASPYRPDVYLAAGMADSSGSFNPGKITLGSGVFGDRGMGSLQINNHDGSITVPSSVRLDLSPGGSLVLAAANIDFWGAAIVPGGIIDFKTYNVSYDQFWELQGRETSVFQGYSGKGMLTLAAGALLSTAGKISANFGPDAFGTPIVNNGGSVSLAGYSLDLQRGSLIDVSGGALIGVIAQPFPVYGNAGSIHISGGHDLDVGTIIDGTLVLGSTLSGYAGPGAHPGSLSVEAPAIQLGGTVRDSRILALNPDFFNRGGFSSFTLTGTGLRGDSPSFEDEIPGIRVALGTVIRPEVANRIITMSGRARDVVQPGLMKPATVLSLNSTGLLDPKSFTPVVIQGKTVIEGGGMIELKPQFSLLSAVSTVPAITASRLTVGGKIVEIAGILNAPGGTIILNAAGAYPENNDTPQSAFSTLSLLPGAVVSAAGMSTLLRDPLGHGRRIGGVVNGGSVSLTGNLFLASGSMIDASGSSASLYSPSLTDKFGVSGRSTMDSRTAFSQRTRIDSDGGLIELNGKQTLVALGSLKATAGGPNAGGGTLRVSSGRFYNINKGEDLRVDPRDLNLLVTQDATSLAAAISADIASDKSSRGYFYADAVRSGGFDSVQLGGNVEFSGPVSLSLPSSIRVATGGVMSADNEVSLTATHVALGTPLTGSLALGDPALNNALDPALNRYMASSPGPGSISVKARIIEIGNLLLKGLSKADLVADGGVIRGDGTFNISGNVLMKAAQIYPVSASRFTVAAYSNGGAGGEIVVQQSGNLLPLPLSAGGNLSLYASRIIQNGTLSAPFGTINLGWDGTGSSPMDPLSGAGFVAGRNMPVTQSLVMGAEGLTSVSAIDPSTSREMVIPYGIMINGTKWIDPKGEDISATGLPSKGVSLSAARVVTENGSVIDLRGGGDLIAYQWNAGLKGTVDPSAQAVGEWDGGKNYSQGSKVLYRGKIYSAKQSVNGIAPDLGVYWSEVRESYAVLPGFGSDFLPVLRFPDTGKTAGDPGFVSSTLSLGDKITLSGGNGLAGGTYTLLPSRYALLPGSYLITPTGLFQESEAASQMRPDGTALVAGHRFNALNPGRGINAINQLFEILSPGGIMERSDLVSVSASSFLPTAQRFSPVRDAAGLSIKATTAMNLMGSVAGNGAPGGRGANIDLGSSRRFEIGGQSDPSSIALDAATLSSWKAGSLLIGGERVFSESEIRIVSSTSMITVHRSVSPLQAGDLILAASDGITIEDGARIASTGSANSVGAMIQGNGAAIRVSSDAASTLVRDDSSGNQVSGFNIASGALLSGGSIILDSSGVASIGDDVRLDTRALTIAAGAINLSFDGSRQSSFLNLSDTVLSGISGLDSLTIASYSGISSRGSGQLGSTDLGNLTLRAGSFSGDANSDVSLRAKRIALENTLSSTPLAAVSGQSGSTLEIVSDLLVTGNGRMSVSGFADVSAFASKGVQGSGDGALVVNGNLGITTPLFAGEASSKSRIEATGRLVTTGIAGSASVQSGLGSSLIFKGASVDAGAKVSRPSGEIILEAATGDVTVTSLLDVSGVIAGIHDLQKTTDGGQITLSSKTGDVRISANASLNAGAPTGGGNAGSISLLAPLGTALIEGGMSARSPVGKQGDFTADLARYGSSGDLGPLGGVLTAAGLTGSQSIRIRNGDVTVSGVKASRYKLSADTGSIFVDGLIDASGQTGGSISLIAGKSVIANPTAVLSVRGRIFDNAGKGGSISLEAGANSGLTGGVAAAAPSSSFGDGINVVDIRAGSVLDLGIDQLPLAGQLTGVLHLKAPRTLDGSDLQINPIGGTVRNASAVVMEGLARYDAASISDASVDSFKDDALANAASFMSSVYARPVGAHRILSMAPGLAGIADFNPGIEIMNSMGGLVLNEDWDLSLARYGAQERVTDLLGNSTGSMIGTSAGHLRLKALGDITFLGSLSDGFGDSINDASQSLSIDGSSYGLQFAQLLPLLDTGAGKRGQNSWSYSITAGGDMGAADAAATRGAGSVRLGKLTDNANLTSPSGEPAMTASSLDGNYQVIRTGNGSIRVHAGDDIQLRNQFATIYTAGTLLPDQTLGGRFDIPSSVLSLSEVGNNSSTLGMYQQPSYYLPQYSFMGGDVSLSAAGNILRVQELTRQFDSAGREIQTPYEKDASLTADSSRQLPIAWLMRRGQIKADGTWDIKTSDILDPDKPEVASTTWWVNYANFFQGVGALGGGNVSVIAAGDIRNMDVSIPTQGRLTSRAVSGGAVLKPSEGILTETGGGDMTVRAGGDIDAGVYYVERGDASLRAGGSIVSNKTRDAKGDYLNALSDLNNNASSANPEAATWLPTSFFAGGKSRVSVVSRGDALLGPVGNVFLMPQGINNDLAYKNYFSTYGLDPAKGVTDFSALSLGGGITLRTQLLNTPAFQTWALHNGVTKNGGKYQPWVRTVEADPSSTELSGAAGLMAPNVRLTALGGDLMLAGALTMAPSPTGNASFAAKGDIQGVFKQESGVSWATSLINLSDASMASIPSYNAPLSQSSDFASSPGIGSYLASFNASLSETASYSGVNAAIQGKIARHDQGLLHRGDASPMLLYAEGDVSGLQFFSPKMARIIAGNDLSDVAISIQHLSPSDVSLVSAGGMMRLYDANTERLTAAQNDLANLDPRLPRPAPRSGDLQVSGPGLLQVLARGDIDLGTGDVNADGTGVGISSIGNARNPALPFEGADIFVGAGLNLPFGLNGEALDVQSFVTQAKALPDAARYLQFLKESISQGGSSSLEAKVEGMSSLDDILTSRALTAEDRARLGASLFYIVLREAGRDYNREGSETFGTYANGEKAIASFFKTESSGDIRMNSRDIRTKSGGGINMMAPGGGISLAPFAISASAAPPGIVTESGGGINIFTKESVSLGIGRIFTLRGGDIMIWSDQGDIAAGSSAKTVATAPPTRVVVDPQSGEVLTDLAGLATGGGIGVLATVKGVPPGNVDLIAPVGAIDAGDAGIRSTGNLNLAAARVLNANNISVGGSTSGAPPAPPPPAAPNVSGATAASAASAGNNASAQAATKPPSDQPREEAPSVISVEVLGYGGGEAPAEEEPKKSAVGASMAPPQASL